MRYLKASIIIGLISAFIVGALYGTGFTRTLDMSLKSFFGFAAEAPQSPNGLQFISLFIIAWLIAWTTIDIVRPLRKSAIAFLTILLLLTGAWVLSLYGHFFSPFPSIGSAVLSFIIGSFYSQSDAGQRKKILIRLFGQRLSKKSLHRLIHSETPLDFPGDRQDCSLLVCEITNHAHLMDLDPHDYVAMTNLYLRTASDYLVDVGGYLDACNGESIRVVFGTPVTDESHAISALKAALELATRLDTVNKECDAQWHHRFEYCIGVHSGKVVAAAFGGSRLGSFSVAGEPVEFTSRLCTAATIYGAKILTASDTFEETVDTFETRPMDLIFDPVSHRRIEIYEVLSLKNGLSPERRRSRDHFWKGVIYYREKKWDRAVEEFSHARISGLPDPALDFYVQRIERARRGETETSRAQNALVNVL